MIGAYVVIGAWCLVIAPLAWAKEPSKKKPDAAAMAAQQAEERVRTAKALLSGTQWTIELTPMSGEQPKRPAKDTLHFEQNTVVSQQLSSAGFPATGYSLSVAEDGTTVWETMQTAQDTSVVFWRGELHGETMRGTLSKHPAKGDAVDLAFSGTRMPAAESAAGAATAVQAPAVPPTVVPETPLEPEKTKPPKKKRGWWQ